MNYTDFLDLRVTARYEDGVTIECPLKEFFFNPDGSLHGGIIATVADEAVWFAIEERFSRSRHSTTTELKVNYLRPVARTSRLLARAKLLKAGKTLCVGSVELSGEDGALCAFATVTYMLLGGKQPSS